VWREAENYTLGKLSTFHGDRYFSSVSMTVHLLLTLAMTVIKVQRSRKILKWGYKEPRRTFLLKII
jgi:hypothetical protein